MAIVSILIPALKAEFLGRALVSAQHQTFDDIEIIVGDDTADAALAPIVHGIRDPRIRYVHHRLTMPAATPRRSSQSPPAGT